MSEDNTTVQSIADLLGSARTQQNAYLIVLNAKTPASVGRMHKLETAEAILGRSNEATIQVDDDGISRKHAKVVQLPNGMFQLIDLGSTNGTWLNGSRVDVMALQDGDKIQIGSNTILKFSIQDQLEEAYQRSIYESATRDGLTKIFNKKYFLDTLRKEFAYCVRHQVQLGLIMFDVDHFKKINDTFGHPAGDHVLMRIAQRVAETVRTEDTFARYGGEEFSILLRETTPEATLACAERCRKAVELNDFTFGGTPIRVTISMGFTNLGDTDFSQPEDLIGEADKYLYRAKQSGRNRVCGKDRP